MIISTRPVLSQPPYLRLPGMVATLVQRLWLQASPQRMDSFRSPLAAGSWHIFDPVTHEKRVVESESEARFWLDQYWQQQESHLAQALQVLMINAPDAIDDSPNPLLEIHKST